MDDRRKDRIIVAAVLLIVALALWAVSTRVDPENAPSLRGMSLEQVDQAGILTVILRFGTYAAAGIGLICLAAAFPLPDPSSTGTQPRASRTRLTLLTSAISSVLCGLILFASPLNFAPGLVFGFCFARVNFSGPRSIALYTAASGFVYLVAYYSLQSSGIAAAMSFNPGLMLAGAIGGLGLAVSTKLLAGIPLALRDEGGALILGAVVAVPFLVLYELPVVGLILAFAFWQIPVGWYLAACLQRSGHPRRTTAAETVPRFSD